MREMSERKNEQLIQKIQSLIIGRLLTAFLILLTTWLWRSEHARLSFENFPKEFFFFFLIYVALTIVYFFILRLNSNYTWQIRIQLAIDVILISWLVWQTGDATSPYIVLYILLISIASLFMRPKETLFIGIFSTALLTLISSSVLLGYIESFGVSQANLRTFQIIGFQVIALLIVSLLSLKLSERRVSESELDETAKTLANLRILHERIIQSIRSGLIVIDFEGRVHIFNAAAEEITGYKASEIKGKRIENLFGNLEESVAISLQAIEKGEQPPRFEGDIITPEGFAIHVGYNLSPLFSENNQISGLIITFQDLTEVRAMEESVRRKERLAAVGRIAAGLAHEIRNPLGAISGAIQVLQSTIPKDSPQNALMEIILRESNRLNQIITNFLTYARPRITNFSEVNVHEAINDVFTLLKHSPEVNSKHEFYISESDPNPIILADPTQLKQIFWNLAQNSIKAMPDGGTISVAIKRLNNQRIKISFSDTGCGMSAQQIRNLFEPFSQSTTGGIGLGLSIVYQIVRDHGGSINVRSIEGKGTTVNLEFPPINYLTLTRMREKLNQKTS
mgnify:FL=1